MDFEKAVVEAFKKNRIGVKIIEKYEGYSKIEYVLDRLTMCDISDNKVNKITQDMASLLSFVPEIVISNLFYEISVFVRKPTPEILGYSQKDTLLTDFDKKNEQAFTFAVGSDAIEADLRTYNLERYSPMLIYGDDGYGKTNLIKVILEEFKDKKDFRFIIGDSLSKGEYDSKMRDPRYTVIKEKDQIMKALCNLKAEIQERAVFSKTAGNEEGEEKKQFEPLVFVIDDYANLMKGADDENELKRITAYVSKRGYRYNVFFILSSAVICDIFKGDELSIFKSIISFKCERTADNYLGEDVSYFNIPLYYPGDAVFYDVDFEGGDRVQCFKLEE